MVSQDEGLLREVHSIKLHQVDDLVTRQEACASVGGQIRGRRLLAVLTCGLWYGGSHVLLELRLHVLPATYRSVAWLRMFEEPAVSAANTLADTAVISSRSSSVPTPGRLARHRQRLIDGHSTFLHCFFGDEIVCGVRYKQLF